MSIMRSILTRVRSHHIGLCIHVLKLNSINLLKKEKIRPSKSPHGAPLFFIKYKDKLLRGEVDYRALNRITMRNKDPYLVLMKCSTFWETLKSFYKMDLKTIFIKL